MSVVSRKKKEAAAARQARRREAFRRLRGDSAPEPVAEVDTAKSRRTYDERDVRGAMRIVGLRRRLKNLAPEGDDGLVEIEKDAYAMGFLMFAREVAELRSRETKRLFDEADAKLDEATRKRKKNDWWRRPQIVRQPPTDHGPNLRSIDHANNWPWRPVPVTKRGTLNTCYVLQRSWKHLASQLPTLTPVKGWFDLPEEEQERATFIINTELVRRGLSPRRRRR